jgi:hypothetical protein
MVIFQYWNVFLLSVADVFGKGLNTVFLEYGVASLDTWFLMFQDNAVFPYSRIETSKDYSCNTHY